MVQILPRRWRELGHEIAKFGSVGVSSLSRFLPKRFQGVSDEVIKFAVIGVINLVVNFAVVNLLWITVLRNGELKAKAIATIVATTCAYFMNRHWTYRDRPKSALKREYTLFLFFNAVGLAIEVAVVGVAKYGFDQTNILVFNVCTGIGIILGTIFRFWAYRTHVFKLDTGAPAIEEPVALTLVAALATVPDPALTDDAFSAEDSRPNADQTEADQPNADDAGKPRDEALQDELTQIELENLVAREQTTSREP